MYIKFNIFIAGFFSFGVGNSAVTDAGTHKPITSETVRISG